MINIKFMLLNLIPIALYRMVGMYNENVIKLNLVETHLYLLILLGNLFFYSMVFLVMDKDHPRDTLTRFIKAPKKDFALFALFGFPTMLIGNFLYLVSSALNIQLFSGTAVVFNTLASVLINKNTYLMNWKIIILLIINVVGCALPSMLQASEMHFRDVFCNIFYLIIGAIASAFIEKAKEQTSLMDFDANKFSSVIFTVNFSEFFYVLIFTPTVLLVGKYVGNEFPPVDRLIFLYAFGTISGFVFTFLFFAYDYSAFQLKSVEMGINENVNLVLLSLFAVLVGFDKINYILFISLALTILSSFVLTILISREEEKHKKKVMKCTHVKVNPNTDS